MTTFSCALMGANFRGPDVVNHVKGMSVNDEVTFVREPENAYDSNAIQIHHGGIFIGFVERGLAEELAPLIDAHGAELSGHVTGFLSPIKPYIEIGVTYPSGMEEV